MCKFKSFAALGSVDGFTLFYLKAAIKKKVALEITLVITIITTCRVKKQAFYLVVVDGQLTMDGLFNQGLFTKLGLRFSLIQSY